MRKIRAIVVDDSAFMRKMVSDMLDNDPGIEVVYRARNGAELIEKVREYAPHVITMDVEMPKVNGLEALKWLMEHYPLPVVMLSSLTQQGADTTIKALEAGAVDFVGKPSGSISLDIEKVREELVGKVKAAAGSNVSRVKSPPPMPVQPLKSFLPLRQTRREGRVNNLVLVGTSTGGPKALQVLLSGLPPSLPAAVLIVQHMPAGFTKSLAQRLDQICEFQVVEAEHGQEIKEGTAYIAPGDFHMEVARDTAGELRIMLNQHPPRGGHRPAVDTLFESAASLTGLRKYVVIMTGMGSDGSAGLTKIREFGAEKTIAEHQSTCIVYGMPRAAAQTGLIDEIIPLPEISKFLINHIS